MSDLLQKPLHGAALYNPHLQGKQELVGLFVARLKLLHRLLDDLRATAEAHSSQHHLVIGQRGMGKTMLLQRLAYAIEDDPELSQRFLPLTFPEEQYNVARLSDFWLNCTDALSDALDRVGRTAEAARLDEQAEALRSEEETRRSSQALALLTETAEALGLRLVLLVDNVDLVFERVKEQEWVLREALAAEPALVLIGASASAIESTYSYDRAFYDFFRVHELEGLDLEETRRLIIHYAESWNAPEVKRLAEEDSARIRVLHTLTGGNPRTIVLLFNVLALGIDGDVRSDLEKLLDQCTPLYKARFEALAAQAQQVMHALAIHWDPISAGELAELLAMEVNAVSSQLARLVRQGIVEKVPYEPESKTGFQIAERFFNIWYLMRASRRVRRRLLWLVEFLKMFYSQDQLRERALAHIESGLQIEASRGLRHAEYSFALAEAIMDETWRGSLEKTGLHALLRDEMLRSQLTDLIDLERDPSLKQRAELQRRLEKAGSKVVSAQIDLPGWSGAKFWTKLKESPLLPLATKIGVAERLPDLERELIAKIQSSLGADPERIARYLCARTTDALSKAVQGGLMTDHFDLDGAAQAEAVLDTPGLKAVALARKLSLRPDRKLLSLLWKELALTTSPFPWLIWLKCVSEGENPPDATRVDKAIKRIVALAGGDRDTILDLKFYLTGLGRFADAEAVLRHYLAVEERDAGMWVYLGEFLAALQKFEEAKDAARKALELDPENGAAWTSLSTALLYTRRLSEAEQAARKGIELNSKDPRAWYCLGAVLFTQKRFHEAEQAQRRAVELQEDWINWLILGGTLHALNRLDEAEEAYRRALALDPSVPLGWLRLGFLLNRRGRHQEEEEAYRKAAEVAPGFSLAKPDSAWLLLRQRETVAASEFARKLAHTANAFLATFLAAKGEWEAAAAHARRFVPGNLTEDSEIGWAEILAFLQAAVRTGKAREAIEILEETSAAERWRPLREALEAAARNSKSYLRRVAPEVRQPARQILKQLLGEADEE